MVCRKLLARFYLFLAIFFEVAGTTSMKLADGFMNLGPSCCIFIFYTLSFLFLSFAIQCLDLTFAYALWSGIGTCLTAMIGFSYFNEPFSLVKGMSLGLIVLGVVGLKCDRIT